jgi:small subunit ribosomal protein S5
MANNETPKPADNAGGAKPADAAAKPADAGKPGDSRPGDNRGGDNRGGDNRGGGYRGGGNHRGPRKDFSPPKYQDKDGNELTEKVVFINRCSKVVKGGRRFSFSALVVSGNQKGSVGVGFGKANEVAECIRKANETASKSLQKMQLNNGTIPHEIYAESGGGKVLLKPASPGTGIIAGGGVRAVCEAVGITDVLAKSIGSNNHANVVKATLKALSQLRNRDEILTLRGKKKEKAI